MMSSFLTSLQYPWSLPQARQLHETLTDLFPTSRSAVYFAQGAGVDTGMIFREQAPFFVWKEVLEEAARTGVTVALVERVRDRLHATSPARPYLEDLLAGRPTRTSGEPRSVDGAPVFITGGDGIAEPEALLFHDDLTIQMGRVPALIHTLERLVTLAPAVCKLTVDIGGRGQYGTAFRIGADLLLTNWHVVHERATGDRATTVTAEFAYEDDGRGGLRETNRVECDVNSIVADEALDWGVVRVAETLNDDWSIVPLSAAITPTRASAAFIIQHPLGHPKRVGIVRNQVSYVGDRVVHYLTDTQIGSSGAPVLDSEGRLIALHHAGGRPQDVPGKPPMRKNEGILMSQVIDSLRGHGIQTS